MLSKSLIKSQQRDNHVYITPEDLAKDMIKIVPISPGDTLLDPCRGETQVFLKNFPEGHESDWCEITEGRDFLTYENKVDWVIGNPPYGKHFMGFLEHSLEIARKGVCYVMPSYGLSRKRSSVLKKHGFKISKMYLTRVWFGFPNMVVLLERGEWDDAIKPEYKSPYKGDNNKELDV